MCADWFVTQAISAQDEKLAQTMFLPLAERMVEKMVKEEKIEAEAEVSAVSLTPHVLDSCFHEENLCFFNSLSPFVPFHTLNVST